MKAVGINAQNQPVSSEKAVAVRLQLPEPVGPVVLPLAKFGYNCAKFTWNGDCEKPTIRPNIWVKSFGCVEGLHLIEITKGEVYRVR